MARYLIKMRQRVFEAENSAQLARMALMGLIPKDALIRGGSPGRWVRAEEHPDLARLFWQSDTERTMVASLTQAKGNSETRVFWVKTDVSTVEVRGFEVMERLFELGVIRSSHEVSEREGGPFEPVTGHPELTSIFGPKEHDALKKQEKAAPQEVKFRLPNLSQRLEPTSPPETAQGENESEETNAEAKPEFEPDEGRSERPEESLSTERKGEVTKLEESKPEVTQPIASLAREPESIQGEISEETQPMALRQQVSALHQDEHPGEISVVVTLSEEEIEYFQDASSDDGGVVLLSASDLEVIEEPIIDEPKEVSAEEVIPLSFEDIEELEDAQSSSDDARPLGEPSFNRAWLAFRKSMNGLTRRVIDERSARERTWDLFRSMMELPRRDGRVGPSEASWRRFKERLVRPRADKTRPPETTWDRFRALMSHADSAAETTWDRFMKAMKERRDQMVAHRRGGSQYESPLHGEAPIRSNVSPRSPRDTGPNIRVDTSLKD